MTEFEEKFVFKFYVIPAIIVSILILILAFFIPHANAQDIPEESAVRAIIGEASNQGYDGMLAVACAIRNRGSLRGVYGAKAKHVSKEPKRIFDLARRAWKESSSQDIVRGATHWENVKAFGVPYWAKSMQITCTVGDHRFYRGKQ